MNTKNKVLISIVIPAYKAEKVISETLLSAKNALDELGVYYEIICVVDGEVDKTKQVAQKLSKKYPGKIRVLSYKQNRGKGNAVRYGMSQAKGDIIGFIDVGLDINLKGISMLLAHFRWYDADIIIGSKRHPASLVVYPWQRKLMSFGYQTMCRILFGLKVRDTQVGMKFFRREVVDAILPRLLVKQFAFDIEMLAVANYLGYKRIYEAPIELKLVFKGDSTIFTQGFIKTIYSMLWDTAAVFYRLKILKYYDNKNKKNWITPDYSK
jgi:glycosyltransferase involved in cell wall biosynthesis